MRPSAIAWENSFLSRLVLLGSLEAHQWFSSSQCLKSGAKKKHNSCSSEILETGWRHGNAALHFVNLLVQHNNTLKIFSGWSFGMPFTGKRRRINCQSFPRQNCSKRCPSGIGSIRAHEVGATDLRNSSQRHSKLSSKKCWEVAELFVFRTKLIGIVENWTCLEER